MAAFAARKSSGPVIRSISPSSRLNRHCSTQSPTRVNLYDYPSPSFSFFSVDRPVSRSDKPQKWTCMCSPTNHPGSFRCSLHKGNNSRVSNTRQTASSGGSATARLNIMRRSAMRNALVRIGTVEGDSVIKRALAAIIRPSCHQQRRRGEFRPSTSRLSAMSKV